MTKPPSLVPSDQTPSRCKACNALIYFVKDPAGKWQCLDAAAPVYRLLSTTAALCVRDPLSYVAHWTTCPQAHEVRQLQILKEPR